MSRSLWFAWIAFMTLVGVATPTVSGTEKTDPADPVAVPSMVVSKVALKKEGGAVVTVRGPATSDRTSLKIVFASDGVTKRDEVTFLSQTNVKSTGMSDLRADAKRGRPLGGLLVQFEAKEPKAVMEATFSVPKSGVAIRYELQVPPIASLKNDSLYDQTRFVILSNRSGITWPTGAEVTPPPQANLEPLVQSGKLQSPDLLSGADQAMSTTKAMKTTSKITLKDAIKAKKGAAPILSVKPEEAIADEHLPTTIQFLDQSGPVSTPLAKLDNKEFVALTASLPPIASDPVELVVPVGLKSDSCGYLITRKRTTQAFTNSSLYAIELEGVTAECLDVTPATAKPKAGVVTLGAAASADKPQTVTIVSVEKAETETFALKLRFTGTPDDQKKAIKGVQDRLAAAVAALEGGTCPDPLRSLQEDLQLLLLEANYLASVWPALYDPGNLADAMRQRADKPECSICQSRQAAVQKQADKDRSAYLHGLRKKLIEDFNARVTSSCHPEIDCCDFVRNRGR